MSGRNRGPQVPAKGVIHGGMHPLVHELPQFVRGRGPVPHHVLLEEMREPPMGLDPRQLQLPPHPAIMEERLAVQHEEIQGLLIDNQRLAATHVALKQELEAAQFELRRTHEYAGLLHAERDIQMRELHDKSVKLERELQAADNVRAELMQVRGDIKGLSAAKQELTAKSQLMTEDLGRMTADLQRVPALKAEIEGLKQELQRTRTALEYEKKGYADNYEHGQLMEKKLVSMARELEKLRAEMANSEKRARATAAIGNSGPGYNANYGNVESVYPANTYSANYGMNPNPTNSMPSVPNAMEGYPQYGPGPGNWGAYDMQRAQGPR